MNAAKTVIVLSVIMMIFAGCTQEKELTVMIGGTPSEFPFWEKVASQFGEKSGVPVKILRSTAQTEQRKQQILIALRGKRPDPDVIAMDIAWIAQMAASNWLEPLGSYNIDTSAFFGNIIRLADTYDGNIIGLPLFVDAGVLYYRTDLLNHHGYDNPPRTWSELLQMATKVQEAVRSDNESFWGFVWQGAQYEGLVCNALEFFESNGGGFFSEDGEPTIDAPENVAALTYMVSLIHDEKISPPNTFTDMKEEEVRQVFHSGNALFERNWPYAAKLHANDDSPVADIFAMSVLPHFDGHQSASTLGGWHVGVSRFADMKDEAAAFVEYITSFEVQKAMVQELGMFPGRVDVYDDPEVRTERLARLRDVFMTAVPRPMVPYYSQISAALQKYLNAALANRMSPQEALSGAQDEAEQIINKYAQ